MYLFKTDPCGNILYYQDIDGDGYGDPVRSYVGPPRSNSTFVGNNDDCDDTETAINPDATEITGDTVDQNCNGDNDN